MKIRWFVCEVAVTSLLLTGGCGGNVFYADPNPTDTGQDGGVVGPDEVGGDQGRTTEPETGSASEAGEGEGGWASGGEGGSSSGSGASSCEGGPLYTHQVGVAGITWQSCTPDGIDNVVEARAACAAYLAHDQCSGAECLVIASCTTGGADEESGVWYSAPNCEESIVWAYGNTAAPGHVNVQTQVTNVICPSISDPTWN
jgi:hypothetical protein